MEILTPQNIDKNNFNVFIRDLSESLNINLKHIIQDLPLNSKINNNIKNNKQKHKKKADIIREEQTKIRNKKNIENDYNKIEFLLDTIDLNNPFIILEKMKTDEGIEKLKFILLDKYWNNPNKKLYMKFIITLYYQLNNSDNNDFKELITTISNKLENYEIKSYMMKEIGYLLPPLNFWDKRKKILDDWQIEVINYIRKKESVLVRAPTSAGKTFIAMAAGIIHSKILYICPAKPVAYQVGSHFIYMGYKVHFLVENLSHNSFDNKTNIFVGTVKEIENNLYKIGNKFDYIIFDEIHNLNKEDGDIYENLIKIVDGNFLALSATINNIEFLKDKLNEIHNKKIHYIEYKKRFINHQRWIWNNDKIETLHPLCSIEIEDLNDDFVNNSLGFTPNDNFTLWDKMEDIYDDELIEGLSPDDFFKDDKLLSLDDCRDYEYRLKKFLIDNRELVETKELLKEFKCKVVNKKNYDKDIIHFLKQSKKQDMFPMILFNTDTEKTNKLFNFIYDELDKNEKMEYPYHYIIMEKKKELYDKYLERRSQFSDKIKIKTKNAQYEKTDKLENYDKKEKTKYVDDMIIFYDSCKNQINKSDFDDILKNKQIKNLEKEKKMFIENPDFERIDIFKKHDDFCFTMNQPMSGDKIKAIRIEIMKTLGIKIAYEHPIFQNLKRGIGLYNENMPDEYKWILQKLLTKRDIGIVISDRSLSLGIDFSIRSSCLMDFDESNYFSSEDYLQMSGRAGRRGKDDRGNIIFFGNIDFLQLMKGKLPNIIGTNKDINTNYKILHELNKNIKKDNIEKVFSYFFNNRNIIDINENNNDNNKLLWYLRYYNDSNIFIKNLKNIEREIFEINNKLDSELLLLNKINNLINKKSIENEFKLNKIDDNLLENLEIFYEIYEIVIILFNNLNKNSFLLIRRNLKNIYEKVRLLLLKYNGFN